MLKLSLTVVLHRDFATCIGWTSTEELITCGDDHLLLSWNVLTHEATKICDLPSDLFPIDLHCYPKSLSSTRQKHVTLDMFVIGASDGKFYFIFRNGKIDKIVDAHNGAVLTVRWSYDGSGLATSGEDGFVKIWSKSGLLRSTLAANSVPTYCIAWSPQSDQIIYTSDTRLIIKPLAPNSKVQEWRAHDGVILKIAWNHNNNLIISGGEDCKYKVWDSLGRLLFASGIHEFPITSLAWSTDGSLFGIGSFNTLKLCDESGWSYSLDKPQIQSILGLSWSSDSTQIAGVCSNGNVIFAHVINKRVEWKSFEATVVGRKNIHVKNVITNVEDDLDFRDYVIKLSMQFGHLIAITTSQCNIYKTTNWNIPHNFDLKEPNIILVLQCDKHFMLIDANNVCLYSYDGRLLTNIKWIGMRIDSLNKFTISLSSDTIAVRDSNDNKIIHFIDTLSGKMINEGNNVFKHKLEITSVALDYCGPSNERICAFIDKNADIYLTIVRSSYSSLYHTIKLTSMARCMIWNDDANILAAIQENNKLCVWIYPEVAFVDSNLLTMTIIEKDANEYGKNCQLITFLDNRLSIRRSDGSLMSSSINPFALSLHSYTSQMQWNEALKLCQFLKDTYDNQSLWGSLAGMALHGRQLQTAEIAYSVINKIDKVLYIQKINSINDKDAKNAEIALICGNIKEAENILIQNGFIFRVILLNLELYKWDRAIELSKKYKKYDDFILAYRQRYLQRFGKKETLKKYRELSNEIETTEWELFEEKVNNPYDERIMPQTRGNQKK